WPQAWCAPSFGLAAAREGGSGGDLLLLRAGPHGQQGAGGHAHNDALAVSVWFGGRPVVIDPGTAVYLGRPALRDRFRGVAAHATLCVDGAEPSPIPATRPFALPDRTRARLTATGEDGRAWGASAVHDGWSRLGVRHRREVTYDRKARTIIITDTVDGTGEHELA